MDTLEETIKQAQWGSGRLIKKYIEIFKENNLEGDEQLIDMAASSGRPTDLLFLTDQRIFYFKMNSKDNSQNKIIGYGEVTAIKLHEIQGKANIEIHSSHEEVKVPAVALPIADQIKTTIDRHIE